ncbi:MAG: Fic family protein [Thermoguttaceae bacterium]|nr:Fic family protein [Thermoguttaceae bacterium]
MERFVNLLKSADEKDFCNKESLIELQNQIVDKRFAVKDYRTNQNYVGSTLLSGEEKIHYIPPRPENLSFLMDGLIESHKRMAQGGVSAIAHAAAIAWGFVFLHPFEDGNGRSHRFLIHNILALAGFTPPGFIFPISAVMLKNMDLYDQSLECFSVPLVQLTDYDLDDEGVLMVNNDTGRFYRYIDFTTQTETLLQFIDKTVETELVIELDYLKRYDKTKLALQEIVDLPGQKLELLIRSLSGNKGILGDIRRRKNFDFLTDDEVEQLESSFRENWGESFDAPDDSLNR